MIQFVVYGEPVAKGRPRFSKRGFAYTPEKTTNYENLVKLSYLDSEREKYLNGEQLRMEVIAYMGISASKSKKIREKMESGEIRPTKKPDCDNLVKICGDSLNGIAFTDDSQIVSLTIDKYYSTEPRAEIKIYPI